MATELQQLSEEKDLVYHCKGKTSSKIKENEWKQSGGARGEGFDHVWKAASLVIQTHFLLQSIT